MRAFLNVIATVTLTALVLWSTISATSGEQQSDPKTLFEAGQWDQAITATAAQGEQPSPESSYLAAQSYLRRDQADGARAQFAKLTAVVPDDRPTAWSLVGQSAAALLDGHTQLGIDNAQRATDMASDRFHPHYQLGLALSAAQQWERAAVQTASGEVAIWAAPCSTTASTRPLPKS